jgi:myosin-crossreactive antigen
MRLKPWGVTRLCDELRRPYFTVEYCVRIAEMAVYQWLGIDREIPPVK